MARIQTNAPSGGLERDWVRFYSRLTRSLEARYGRDGLARYLTGIRKAPSGVDPDPGAEPALSRFFRRMGLLGAEDDFGGFLPGFLRRVGGAVSRPEAQVYALVKAHASGAGGSGLKPVCGPTPDCRVCDLTRDCDWYNSPLKPGTSPLSPSLRLLAGPEGGLSDAELLALVLFGERATGREALVDALLDRYGGMRPLFAANPCEYAGMRDCSRANAVRLASVAALFRRVLAEKRGEVPTIACAKDFYDRYAPELRGREVEAAVLVMLDRRNNVVRDAWFADGPVNFTSLTLPDLLRPAIREEAAGIALVHVHPSGDPEPSLADRDFTRRLCSSCETLGLLFVDHVIVAGNGYYSFAENSRQLL